MGGELAVRLMRRTVHELLTMYGWVDCPETRRAVMDLITERVVGGVE